MDTRDAGHGDPEVLEIGHDPGPPRLALVATVGALFLGLGAALGATLASPDSPHPPAGRILLSVGAVTENPDLFGSSRYLASVHNLGDSTVTVRHTALEGWAPDGSVHEAIAISPGGWQSVPLAVLPACDGPPRDLRAVVVRGTVDGRDFQRVLPAYDSVDPLLRDWEVRCFPPDGRPPTPGQLLGTWLVRAGEYLPGTILVRFLDDGRLVVDDGTKQSVHDSERVVGRWVLNGSRIAVEADTGSHCSLGNRWQWDVEVDRADWLHLRHSGGGPTACRRDLDRVWVAERVAP